MGICRWFAFLAPAAAVALPLSACAEGVPPEGPGTTDFGASDSGSALSGSGGTGPGGAPTAPAGGSSSAGTTGAGGAGASSGTGAAGAIGSGGASGGSGGTREPPPPESLGDIAVQYKANGSASDNDLKPDFSLDNRGSVSIPLALLTIRYWYTADGSPQGTDYQELNVDYADIERVTSTSVTLAFGRLEPAETGADHYIEVGFEGDDSLDPGQSTNQIQVRVNWKNYTQAYDETDDYSWDGSISAFTDWHKVTLYQDGVLIWGVEPDGTTPEAMQDAGPPGALPDAGADAVAP